MAQETRSTIENEIQNQFPDNNVKQITAADLRAFQLIMSDSKFNLLDDDINSIKVDANNASSQTLGQYLDTTIPELERASVPAFYVEFTVQNDGDVVSWTSNNPTVLLDSNDGPGVVISYESQDTKWGSGAVLSSFSHQGVLGDRIVAILVSSTVATLILPGTESGASAPQDTRGTYRIDIYASSYNYLYDQ